MATQVLVLTENVISWLKSLLGLSSACFLTVQNVTGPTGSSIRPVKERMACAKFSVRAVTTDRNNIPTLSDQKNESCRREQECTAQHIRPAGCGVLTVLMFPIMIIPCRTCMINWLAMNSNNV